MSTGILRPLEASDLPDVVEIDKNNTGQSRMNFFEKRISAALDNPKQFIYIACEQDGQLQGYLLARIQEGEFGVDNIVAVIDDIGVKDDSHGKGIGRRLMDELTTIIQKKGIHEINSQADWTEQKIMAFFAATGFTLAPRYIYQREAGYLDLELEEEEDDLSFEIDFSDPSGDSMLALSRDKILCRSMKSGDLPAIIKIDSKITSLDHSTYFKNKIREALEMSGIRVSLVAELDEHVVGFAMVRVDFGEFGRTSPSAVIDTLGVDPDYSHKNVGSALLSQLMGNLTNLRVDNIRTEVNAKQLSLLGFLQNNGFEPAQSLSLSKAV